MDLTRRRALRLGAGLAILPTINCTGLAQSYPSKPIRLVVPFPPAGVTDIVARVMSQSLSQRLGQTVIIENKAGAGGSIGTESVVKAAPDGYTLLLTGAFNTINAAIYKKLPFDFRNDIQPIAGLIRTYYVIVVHPSVPARTLPEFIAYAKANPGKLNLASAGNGTPQHINGELFKLMSGINLVHVPYRGVGPALGDLVSGSVHVMIDNLTSSLQHLREGKLRALAVTSPARSDFLPAVQAANESVPGFEAAGWLGVGAPKGLPQDISQRLNHEINDALADPEVSAKLMNAGGAAMILTPGEFRNLITRETDKYEKVAMAAGIKAE